MDRIDPIPRYAPPLLLVMSLAAASTGWAQEAFSETQAIIEINATDGDAGFHVRLDADGWRTVTLTAPDGQDLFAVIAQGALAQQGVTENFFESAEPLCAPDEEEPDAEVVPLSEFLARFPAGTYGFAGTALGGAGLEGTAELSHTLPPAPQNLSFDGTTVTWMNGSDLGRCHDGALVADGTIPDPASVAVTGWEVAVEPDEDVLAEAEAPRVFSIRLPASGQPVMAVTVPSEYIAGYRAEGVTDFKVEVGAIEAGGNRTFTEETFELE